MDKEFIKSIEEGKKVFVNGKWYIKSNGELLEQKEIIKNFKIDKCPLCGEKITKEIDRKSFIDWNCCSTCYYHKVRVKG